MKAAFSSSKLAGERPATAELPLRARLLPTEDGWSLVTLAGRVLLRGQGYRSRRQCLEFARLRGIVALSH
jgi:hypothetical protein